MQIRTLKFLKFSAPLVIFLSAAFFAIYLGVDRKSCWEGAWGFFGGGTVGAFLGWGFFFVVGAVGWVSGPVFGAIGAVGLILGGALGGMGLGSIVDKLIDFALDPSDFRYNLPIVASITGLGCVLAWAVYVSLDRRLDRLRSTSLHSQELQ